MRPNRCVLCGRLCVGVTCHAHSDVEIDTVPPDPLRSIPMQAAATLGEAAQSLKGKGAR